MRNVFAHRIRVSDVRGRLTGILNRVAGVLVFAYLTVVMLLDPVKAPLNIPGTAFAISLALSAVAFSYARTFNSEAPIGLEVRYAGESFVSAAVGFLLASVCQYGSSDLPRHIGLMSRYLPTTHEGRDLTPYMFYWLPTLLALGLFLQGLLYFSTGVLRLSAIVHHQAKHYQGPKSYVPQKEVYDRHLNEIDQQPSA